MTIERSSNLGSSQVVTVGMIPVKDNVGDPVSWRYTDQVRNGDVLFRGDADDDEITFINDGSAEDQKDGDPLYQSIRVLIHKPENVTLGCSIYCGSESRYHFNIFDYLVSPLFPSNCHLAHCPQRFSL